MIRLQFNVNFRSSAALLALGLSCRASGVMAAGPSFDCRKVKDGSIEQMICVDDGLAKLDRELAKIHAAASKKATNEHPPVLKAEQASWINGRNDCWKSDNKPNCVEKNYQLRIAELQAKYRLVPASGPVTYFCGGNPRNEVVVTYFHTEPRTLIAECGDQRSLMYVQPSGSGAKYQGRNESLWEHQSEALITWGYGSKEMKCRKQ